MRIGEFAERTNVPARLLRYYEEQGLIAPDRAANGYRDYPEALVEPVKQIRGLLDAGLPIKIIEQILPHLDDPRTIHVTDATDDLIETLEQKRDQMSGKINCLTRNRDAIEGYLEAIRHRRTMQP